MRSANQLKPIDLIKLRGYPGPKQPACPSRADGPCFCLLWVTPHEVTEGAFMGDLTDALYRSYLEDEQSSVSWSDLVCSLNSLSYDAWLTV